MLFVVVRVFAVVYYLSCVVVYCLLKCIVRCCFAFVVVLDCCSESCIRCCWIFGVVCRSMVYGM